MEIEIFENYIFYNYPWQRKAVDIFEESQIMISS